MINVNAKVGFKKRLNYCFVGTEVEGVKLRDVSECEEPRSEYCTYITAWYILEKINLKKKIVFF